MMVNGAAHFHQADVAHLIQNLSCFEKERKFFVQTLIEFS
jgi:hypothetical protein